jgi:uncharacterized membrane protein YhaH (DUF805 family)
MSSYLKVLKNYAVISGRSTRREYWMFSLVNFLIRLGLICIDVFVLGTYGFFSAIYSIIIVIPAIAVAVRRLHDINMSGWMFFIVFIPLIGGIWILILLITPGDIGANSFGPDPYQAGAEDF